MKSNRRCRSGDLPLEPLIEPSTRRLHDSAVLDFQFWLSDHDVDLPVSMLVRLPQTLAALVCAYGVHLYRTGRPMYWFLMCVTALQRAEPAVRPCFKSVWQLATNWRMMEPVTHRVPIPLALMKALVAVALAVGFRRFAGCVFLSFHGLARIGEVLRSTRGDLLLPSDTLFSVRDRSFLHFRAPKSRRRGGAAQQHSLVKGYGEANFLHYCFAHLKQQDTLYDMSASTFRKRWGRFLCVLGLPGSHRFTPGGLRGGGAVAAYMRDIPIADIMWRMRVRSTSTLEHYLQEVAALVSLRSLPANASNRIQECALTYDAILAQFSLCEAAGSTP